jgi:hypothetical protein
MLRTSVWERALFGALAITILVLVRDAWALGSDTCAGSIASNGTITCANTNCAGACAADGSWVSGACDEFRWVAAPPPGHWEKVVSHGYGEVEWKQCNCAGTYSPCCDVLKIKDGASFKYGTYGTCTDCGLPEPCKPSGNPSGAVVPVCD